MQPSRLYNCHTGLHRLVSKKVSPHINMIKVLLLILFGTTESIMVSLKIDFHLSCC